MLLPVFFLLASLCCQSANPGQPSVKLAQAASPGVSKDTISPKWIPARPDFDTKAWTELVRVAPTVRLDMRYATSNNFVKAKMYPCERCFFRPEVAEALVKVHQELRKKGYGGLKMFDCYRPRPIQQQLWNKVPDARYVTPPSKGSMHNRGAAVDLTIVDKDGIELDMGTTYDFFGEKAYQTCTDLPKKVLSNRKLLKQTMEKYGFKAIRTEWWHYSYNKKSYELSDIVWQCE